MRILMLRAVAVVATIVAVGALSISTVFAHAEPATITPADGSTVTAPAQVVMTTVEEMDPAGDNGLHVFNASGVEVTTVAATVDQANHARISVPLPPGLAPGRYTIKWNTTSAEDGDEADGEFTFTIAAQATVTATATATATATRTATPATATATATATRTATPPAATATPPTATATPPVATATPPVATATPPAAVPSPTTAPAAPNTGTGVAASPSAPAWLPEAGVVLAVLSAATALAVSARRRR